MKFKLACIILMASVFGLVAQAAAHPGSHGDGKASPFHGKGTRHSLHCLLLGHHANQPCPHILPANQGKRCLLSTDCRGKTQGAGAAPMTPQPSLEESGPGLLTFRNISPLVWQQVFLASPPANTLDPPPKTS